MFRGAGNAASCGFTGIWKRRHERPSNRAAYGAIAPGLLGLLPVTVPNAQASDRLNTPAKFSVTPGASRKARHRPDCQSSAKLGTGKLDVPFRNAHEYDDESAATEVPMK